LGDAHSAGLAAALFFRRGFYHGVPLCFTAIMLSALWVIPITVTNNIAAITNIFFITYNFKNKSSLMF
jgi:hypothetical protein